jgi:hypothetical protein
VWAALRKSVAVRVGKVTLTLTVLVRFKKLLQNPLSKLRETLLAEYRNSETGGAGDCLLINKG